MFKKLTMWFFFTIVAGILPIGFKWIVCEVAETPFTYSSVCSEIFFFNVILAADGLKELYDIDNAKRLKVLLFASLTFIIIILSAIYGILLLHDYQSVNLSLNLLYVCSKIFTVCCLIINFSIQILGGVRNDN